MVRRNVSYQQLLMDSLGDAEKSANSIAANRRADAENTRAEAESKANLGLRAEQTRGAKIDADKAGTDYQKLLQEENLRSNLRDSTAHRSQVQEGEPTADGHAVDFQSAKAANKDTRQADMALWNFMNPGNPLGADQLAEKRARDVAGEEMAAEEKEFGLGEKKNKATRDAEAHTSTMETDKVQRTLLGAQAGKATRDANAPPKPSELPIDVRSEVQALSGKTAGKKAIANQLRSDLLQMREAMGQDADGNPVPGKAPNEDLAYSYAQNMLKTMNSKEGADAVGVDEAKRAAGLLEYNVADVKAGLGMKPGKFHGRDIPGFMQQVQSNITGIDGAVTSNKTEVDNLMGRAPAAGNPDSEAVTWAKANPSDPRAARILKLNGAQ